MIRENRSMLGQTSGAYIPELPITYQICLHAVRTPFSTTNTIWYLMAVANRTGWGQNP